MFTKASKLTDAFVIHCRKMAQRSEQAKQARKRKVQDERFEIFISDYVKHKYPDIYDEAGRFFKILREKNPSKLDLKKTAEYRDWQKQQDGNKKNSEKSVNMQKVNDYSDNMQLKITLLDNDYLKTDKSTLTLETIAEEDIEPSVGELLSDDLLEEIIKELREDPDIKKLFTGLEDQMVFDELDIGMEIELEDDMRLEQELI